ncbi:SusC/RagA family TonB-linked outer membrane protein [Sinomicrobium weinanense]|uniref:TonB-dependent receptor n=1 Tax=Sinomicrobium weinanense TaxID=2842200 RepID=A0A926JT26_9FLAO|nr:TonB-dependent receptor [Sinomicrobium weinanense]MBC9797010.1 TonB-dependent receptor [Sinomicrobium weinanense]MBU3123292.1 TonB-dependent receptor [Sinomicrobium weinanense]
MKVKLFWLLCCLAIFPAGVYAQNTITGKVTDADNQPLPGTNILVQGTNRYAVTDFDGNFSIEASPGEVLEVTYVGFKDRQVTVGDETTLNIVLQEDTSELDEVVVVGYGTQKKADLTGSISSIEAEDIVRQPALTATQAIQGKVPGINIINSDQPGATPTVIIRGLGTALSGRDPLYIVDGMPVDNIKTISPSDILKVDVLKDASSASIYGLRAANGVVIVTTKQGKKGKARFSFDSFYGAKSILNPVKMANPDQYINYFNEGAAAIGGYTLQQQQLYNTDWYNELAQVGSINNNTFAVSGGSDHIDYYFSYNHYEEEGVIEDHKYRRGTIKNNNVYKLFDDKLKLTQNLNISFTNENPKPLGAFNNAYRQSPLVPVRYENGRWGQAFVNQTTGIVTYQAGPGESVGRLYSHGNPMADVFFQNEKIHTTTLQGGFTAEFSITDYLKATSRFGATKYFFDKRVFNPTRERWIASDPTRTYEEFEESRSNATNEETGVIPTSWAYNSLYIEDKETFRWNWDGFLTFDKTFDKHHLNVVLGGSKEKTNVGKRLYGKAYEVPEKEQYWSIQHASGLFDNVSENVYYTPRTLMSYFARTQYNFDNKYYITATIRRDGSSVFRTGENFWENFPSFGLGWTVSNEDFLKDSKSINFLKIRGGWGRLGNQNVPLNVNQIHTSTGSAGQNYVLGPNQELMFGASVASPVKDLTWEIVEEWGVGLDFNLLDYRLSGSVDYYDKTTKNMILLVQPLLDSQFAEDFYDHGAEVSNKGMEFTLEWKDNISEDWSYTIGGNFSFNKNMVENVKPAYDGMLGGSLSNGRITKRLEEGQPLGAWWMWETEGVWQNQGEIDSNPSIEGAAPGHLRYKDQNEDGVIDDRDKKFFGSYIPKYNYGVHLGLNYKNIDFSVDGFGVGGNKVYNGLKNTRTDNENITADTYNTRWTGEGSTNVHPGADRDIEASDYYLENGAFFRINNITLGYTLPDFSRYVSKLRFYFTAQNPFMFTDYSGFTPEIIGGEGGNPYRTAGVELSAYPNTKTFIFGINLEL